MELHRGLKSNLQFEEPSTVTITRDSDGKAIVEEVETKEVEEKHILEVEGSLIPEVDLLTVTWEDSEGSHEKTVEVVGDFLITVSSIQERAEQGGHKGEDAPSEGTIIAKRETALREIEDAVGFAFRRRYARKPLDGTGSTRLHLPHTGLLAVIAVEVNEVALSEAELEALTLEDVGTVVRKAGWPKGTRNVVITYAHGKPGFVDAEDPVREYAAYLSVPNPHDFDARATSLSTEDGTFALVTPGVRGARFPLPRVNAFVNRFTTPMVA